MLDLVGNPKDRFSHDEAHISLNHHADVLYDSLEAFSMANSADSDRTALRVFS